MRLQAGMRLEVPFYEQTFDFTCGPACLMMALRFFDPAFPLTRAAEIEIWREANMVEVRGTSSYGLALSAHRRGFSPRIVTSTDGLPLREVIKRRRPQADLEIMELFHHDLKKRCEAAGIRQETREVRLEDLLEALTRGELPILLTSTRISADEHIPHWILVTGWDEEHAYVNNPYVVDGRRVDRLPLRILEENLGFEGYQSLLTVTARRR